ncbi:hypothetical protein AB9G26_08780 [Francisella philomiragia]|uniref:hypothetical protein n=1 Tax=Francisella philomiragia TaxID=28110 RepID=UPI0035112EC2
MLRSLLDKVSIDRLKKIDLTVLLKFFYNNGYSPEDIIFESCLSMSQSGKLIEDITFEGQKLKLVLNMGLLSANSNIPYRILDFFSVHNDSVSFCVLNALASRLLKSQINMLLAEHSDDFKHIYFGGDILFSRNDNFFHSIASFNNIFENILSNYNLRVRSYWLPQLIKKNSLLNYKTSLDNFHLGNSILSHKLHFEIVIQSETLLSVKEEKEVRNLIESTIFSSFFDVIRKYISITVWLKVHPVEKIFLPFNLSNDDTKLMEYKIKIYERFDYET